MPLKKSGSKKAVGENIAEMEASGHPRKQAIAASLSNQRKYADGDMGGSKKKGSVAAGFSQAPASAKVQKDNEGPMGADFSTTPVKGTWDQTRDSAFEKSSKKK